MKIISEYTGPGVSIENFNVRVHSNSLSQKRINSKRPGTANWNSYFQRIRRLCASLNNYTMALLIHNELLSNELQVAGDS